MNLKEYLEEKVYEEGFIDNIKSIFKKGAIIIKDLTARRSDVFKILNVNNEEIEVSKLGQIRKSINIEFDLSNLKSIIKIESTEFNKLRKPRDYELKIINNLIKPKKDDNKIIKQIKTSLSLL